MAAVKLSLTNPLTHLTGIIAFCASKLTPMLKARAVTSRIAILIVTAIMALDPWKYAATGKEHSHQTALFMWANMATQFGLTAADNVESYTVRGAAQILLQRHVDRVPQLEWLHAIHNQGHGDAVRGNKAKAEGVKAGVYDVFLPYPTTQPFGLRAGLYLEMKVGKNGLTAEQKVFKTYAEAVGYSTAEAWTWIEATEKILAYLQISR